MPSAINQAHNITIVYVPPPNSNSTLWKSEITDETIDAESKSNGGFVYLSNSQPIIEYTPATDSKNGFVRYHIKYEGLQFNATSSNRTPWSSSTESPEGLLGLLPLPLHWHVHSLSSTCDFRLKLPEPCILPVEDQEGVCIVHEEKNWAKSFPSAHHWVLGHDPQTSHTISLAGGRTLGMDAYLVGYRNPKLDLEIDFRPPFALRFRGIGPFLSVWRDWNHRKFSVHASNLGWKLAVDVSAPRNTFFSLSEPFPEGFRKNWLAQSLDATVRVRVWRRRWRLLGFAGWKWDWVCGHVFERAGMEFGGDYYPERGGSSIAN